jgi:hypothetical protein
VLDRDGGTERLRSIFHALVRRIAICLLCGLAVEYACGFEATAL